MMIETVPFFLFVFLEILYHQNFRKDKKENSERGGSHFADRVAYVGWVEYRAIWGGGVKCDARNILVGQNLFTDSVCMAAHLSNSGLFRLTKGSLLNFDPTIILEMISRFHYIFIIKL